jgi:transposase
MSRSDARRLGALFIFFGKHRAALKVSFFDGSGMCVFYNQKSSHYTSFDSR